MLERYKQTKMTPEESQSQLKANVVEAMKASSSAVKPTAMTPEESITLIKANLAEVLNPEIIDHIILKEKRPLRVYWGTAPTGKPHCGYFVPLVKIAELLQANCHVKILLADVHAQMENLKAPFELIEHRCDYYKLLITSSLQAIGVDVSQLEFVVGSSFQDSKEYVRDRRRFSSFVKLSQVRKAGTEVVKQEDDPCFGSLEYPILQSLDEQYLDVDAELGGIDQRKIFTFSIDHMPKLGYKVRAHLMNAMVPGLGVAQKMSSSEPNSKINLLDTPEEVTKKLKKAPLVYEDISKFKEDYQSDILTPQTIKPALIKALNDLLDPIRKDFEANDEWQRIAEMAYPVEEKPVKTKKEKKSSSNWPQPRELPLRPTPKALGE
ncbi:hypothetical protein IL306_001300 [Fusarium sp. DS 682]|nr:hypothetical protein IL306_001300 [Fusarium sp. DS 682]